MNSTSNYESLQQEVNKAALKAGRDPKTVQLVAVSKNFVWIDVLPVYEKGCRIFGENRVQEALTKKDEAPKNVQWHLIGNLQKNKVKKIIGNFDLIHSIDSLELAEVLSTLSLERETKTNILLQVNVSGEKSKQGFKMDVVRNIFGQLVKLKGLDIQGLMTIAPLTENQIEIRSCFSKLRELKEDLEKTYQIKMPHLSMGMTNDYKIAIQEGATLVRIGTAIFGTRIANGSGI